MVKQINALIFLDRTGISYYSLERQSIITYKFNPAYMQDMELMDPSAFIKEFTAWIDTNKIVPSHYSILISDSLIFRKDIIDPTSPPVAQLPHDAKQNLKNAKEVTVEKSKKREEEIHNFLELVPFESLLAKVFYSPTITRVIATNQEITTAIRNSLQVRGFTLDAIAPLFIFGEHVTINQGISVQTAQSMLQKYLLITQNNMLENPHVLNENQTPIPTKNMVKKEKIKKNMRLYIMIGVFCFLMIILGIVSYFSLFTQTTPSKQVRPTLSPTITASVSATPTIEIVVPIASPTAFLTEQTVRVNIQYNPQSELLVNRIQTVLGQKGVLNITTDNSLVQSPTRTVILFGSGISPTFRESILRDIQLISPSLSVQENTNTSFDLGIIVGQ